MLQPPRQSHSAIGLGPGPHPLREIEGIPDYLRPTITAFSIGTPACCSPKVFGPVRPVGMLYRTSSGAVRGIPIMSMVNGLIASSRNVSNGCD